VAEVRALLERRGVAGADAERALAEVAEAGYLDDARFARRLRDDRRALDGWGERRIASELARRGVPPELVDATLSGRAQDAEIAAAEAVLEERVGVPPTDDRARRRALGVLARRGYATEAAYEAIRRYERRGASSRRHPLNRGSSGTTLASNGPNGRSETTQTLRFTMEPTERTDNSADERRGES
jgi:regulatory protein